MDGMPGPVGIWPLCLHVNMPVPVRSEFLRQLPVGDRGIHAARGCSEDAEAPGTPSVP